jgi:hypothetical protein
LPFFVIIQAACMNNADRIFWIEQEDKLEVPSGGCLPADTPFVIADRLGIRRSGVIEKVFCFARRHAMCPDMFNVPFIPSKAIVHDSRVTPDNSCSATIPSLLGAAFQHVSWTTTTGEDPAGVTSLSRCAGVLTRARNGPILHEECVTFFAGSMYESGAGAHVGGE